MPTPPRTGSETGRAAVCLGLRRRPDDRGPARRRRVDGASSFDVMEGAPGARRGQLAGDPLGCAGASNQVKELRPWQGRLAGES